MLTRVPAARSQPPAVLPGRTATRTDWPSGVAKYVVPEIVFGAGVLDEIGHAAARLGAVRPLLVTDAGVQEAGWSGQACRRLGGPIFDYEGIDRIPRPIPPLVAAPTTAGIGADVSQFAVITDTRRGLKATLIGKTLVPDISLTDPHLLVTMPDWLSATTGLDALTHGVEAYVSQAASFLTDEHALAAVALVGRHLQRSVHDPLDPEARTAMARASLSAGLAFTNAILGAAHAISHQIGGALDLPHGMLNAILLPHVVRCNAATDPGRFRPLAEALGVPEASGLPQDEVGDALASCISELATSIGAPRTLHEIGVVPSDLPAFARQTLCDACLTTNPRPVTEDDIAGILRAAL